MADVKFTPYKDDKELVEYIYPAGSSFGKATMPISKAKAMAGAKSVSASDKFDGFGIEIEGSFFAGKIEAEEKPITKKGK
jgi:hypothetical protein